MDNKNRNNVQTNPLVDGTKRKIVQKNSIVAALRKRGQKIDCKLINKQPIKEIEGKIDSRKLKLSLFGFKTHGT